MNFKTGIMAKLFVGGIPVDMDERELIDIFTEFGGVVAANVIRDKRKQISRRYGFVEMGTEEEARKAISLLHGGSIDGSEISVRPVIPDLKKTQVVIGKRKVDFSKKKSKSPASKRKEPRYGKRPRLNKGY